MKRWSVVLVVLVAMLAAGCESVKPTGGVFQGDTAVELRGGVRVSDFEFDVAPRHDSELGDAWITDVRLYGFYHALTSESLVHLIGNDHPLPAGSLYIGPYGGWKFEGDNMEAGWVLGGQVNLLEDDDNEALPRWAVDLLRLLPRAERVDVRTEYHHAWTTTRERDDDDRLVTGLQFTFR